MELIGSTIAVQGAGPYAGIRGVVIDETKNMLRIEREGREWAVPKRGRTFELTLEDGSTHTIPGDAIAMRPEDRIKKAPG